jgi:hypothetical protein
VSKNDIVDGKEHVEANNDSTKMFFVEIWLKHEVYFIYCLALLEPYTMTAVTIASCSKPRSQEE